MRDVKFFVGVALMLCIGGVMLFLYNQSIAYEEEEMRHRQMDALLRTLEIKLAKMSDVAAMSAIHLSHHPTLKEALAIGDKAGCIETLSAIKREIDTSGYFDEIKIHLHDAHAKSFVRLWDYHKEMRENLSLFRPSFAQLKRDKKPLKGIEIGRYGMYVRSIAPLLKQETYIGSVETAIGFEGLNDYFEKEGVEFYVLMKHSYKAIASLREYPPALELAHYSILNKKHNALALIHNHTLEGTATLSLGEYHLLHTPIEDMHGNHVGFFVLKW